MHNSTLHQDGAKSHAESLERLRRVRASLKKLRSLMDRLGWTEESMRKHEEVRTCSVDPNHIVPRLAYPRHLRRCKLRRMGYSNEDLEKMRHSSRFYYQDSSNVVRLKFDQKLQDELLRKVCRGVSSDWTHRDDSSMLPQLPLLANRLTSDLTGPQRAAIYDYVVKLAEEERTMRNLKGAKFPPNDLDAVASSNTTGTPISSGSLTEFFSTNYTTHQKSRIKDIHVSKKNYTEILQEVIANQMSTLSCCNSGSLAGTSCTEQLEYSRSGASHVRPSDANAIKPK